MEVQTKRLEGRPVFVVDGSRTPFLKTRGKPGPFTASDLGVNAARPLLARQPFEPKDLDEVIFGCIMPGPEEANIARVIALRLGCGNKMPAWTVQRNCGSGMQAVDNAALDIANGRADLVLAGGTEAMSHAPVCALAANGLPVVSGAAVRRCCPIGCSGWSTTGVIRLHRKSDALPCV